MVINPSDEPTNVCRAPTSNPPLRNPISCSVLSDVRFTLIAAPTYVELSSLREYAAAAHGKSSKRKPNDGIC